MVSPVIVSFLLAAFLFSFIATGIIRRYSINRSLIDIPNERSSHQVPTPRGGGLSISLVILSSVLILFFLDYFSWKQTLALFAGGALVSLTGWLDDHRDLPTLFRAISYLLASCWAVYWLTGFAGFHTTSQPVLSAIFSIIMILGITWLTNLYNFMDGTDAIAAIEAITVATFAAYLIGGPDNGIVVLCVVLLAANAGFLCWNWPPARIFMGDVGSCLTGFIFGCLILLTEITGVLSFQVWLILLSVFIVDATLTLFMRIARGEKWYSAHRSHAYQRLVQAGLSHRQLAVAVLLINILLLWPAAWLIHARPGFDWQVMLLVYLFMTIIWCMIQGRHLKISAERGSS